MNGQSIINVAYAEDHVTVRKSVINLMSNFSNNVSFVVEADNGLQLLERLQTMDKLPDICILDISMPIMNGFDTLTEIKRKWPELNCLIFTNYSDELFVLKTIYNGASGYLVKNCNPEDLFNAIVTLYNYGVYYSNVATRQLFHSVHNKEIKIPHFTEREIQILKYSCSDLTYEEIAAKLRITKRSVEGHRDYLFKKLNINNRVSLALYAVKLGLVNF